MTASPLHDVLAGGGELGERMRAIDWSQTALGPVATWPQSLRTCVRIILTSQQPMFVWWGDELINLYNDAYCSILGGKHPAALGRPASEVWQEIWDAVGPRATSAMRDNQGTFDEALLLIMDRNGYREETYYTFSYSPVPGDQGGPGGILCANSSDTKRIFGERQQALLRVVAALTAEARTARDAAERAAAAIATNSRDAPFALIYLVDAGRPTLAASAGIDPTHSLVQAVGNASDDAAGTTGLPVARAIREGQLVVSSLVGVPDLPMGAWHDAPAEAIGIPIRGSDRAIVGVLVVARSPFRLLDDDYRRFLELLASQIGSAIASARAYETERSRAEALAELDRAKTTFFSNISHEFRTPLTLMLGPTEDALRSSERALRGEALESVHRNELRLLKLVNALLDFSRIEAGRVQANYQPTDLAQLTRELASAFRSAMERAGLTFVVECEALPAPVWVDRTMWENIVLNLLSNALKFTFEGSVTVRLAPHAGGVQLSVTDTGTGVPPEALPHLFERFRRVEGARSRTHEGSGIGLALAHELVKLHHGTLTVTSALGRGTQFVAEIPYGEERAHEGGGDHGAGEPAAAIAAPTLRVGFLEEAGRWLDSEAPAGRARATAAGGPRIIVADDNADMREYLHRLLSEQWDVVVTADGQQALDAARTARPNLILTDVMMPNLDGFGLLEAVRSDPALSTVPVVMLSARAGEEARIEGIEAGADDYLVKPFSARELLARVTNMLQLEGLRREVEHEREQGRLAAVSANRAKDEFLAMLGHELRNPLAPILTAIELMRLRGDDTFARERAVIERQTHHLAGLVDDLLDVSRITRGMVELKLERVRVRELIAKAAEIAAPLLEQQGHVLVTDVSDSMVVDGDIARLTQVFANLLTNAAKYTDAGGRVTVTARQRAGDIEIAVTDTGRGIAADILPHVFDRFVQEAQNLDRSRGGLGLGLAIVRSLVELHGGTVAAASAGPGHGSTFTVTLRAANITEAFRPLTRPRTASSEQAALRPLQILVVDDNLDAATGLAELLTLRGHSVQVAHDAPRALALAATFVPDVALLDLGLPAMDGYELARRLRELPRWRGVRLIAVTGYGQSSDRAQSLAAGFDHHLVKPINLAALQALLDQ